MLDVLRHFVPVSWWTRRCRDSHCRRYARVDGHTVHLTSFGRFALGSRRAE